MMWTSPLSMTAQLCLSRALSEEKMNCVFLKGKCGDAPHPHHWRCLRPGVLDDVVDESVVQVLSAQETAGHQNAERVGKVIEIIPSFHIDTCICICTRIYFLSLSPFSLSFSLSVWSFLWLIFHLIKKCVKSTYHSCFRILHLYRWKFIIMRKLS